MTAIRLPSNALVVLVGPGAAGKSTWAAAQFTSGQVVSSDRLRAVVGEGENDQRAGTDAFDVLELIVERRLRRGLLTVIDTLGLDGRRRRRYLQMALAAGVPCHAVAFDTPADVCRTRNKARSDAIPAKVLATQLASWSEVRAALAGEGFAGVHVLGEDPPEPVRIVPEPMASAPALAARQREDPMPLTFGLQIPSFTWEGGPAELAPRLGAIAEAAEDAGFSSIWVMDHFLQIPQVGREWQDMLDSYTALSYLAARTRHVRLGTLVTGVTYRNIAHLAKIIATLDVLSGGRAVAGLGAGWFEREHKAYGWEFPPVARRFELLEDALTLLPVMWGPGSPPFSGKTTEVAEAICYPRPLQERIPVLVGGGGERKTLRLVAEHADACNIFGDAAMVRHKVEVLRGHCQTAGRDPAEVTVTHLSTALVAETDDDLAAVVERMRGRRSPESFAAAVNAGTVEDHIGRFRGLADAGVHTVMVNLPDLSDTAPVERFAAVIAAFGAPTGAGARPL